jgi:hypothetical protein
MIEKGFILPGGAYVQAIDAAERRDEDGEIIRPEITAADYPEGTIEVPLRPGPGWRWTGAEWVDETPPPPPPEPPELSRAQFDYLLALTGFGAVWDALADNAEAAGDRETFARLKAERSRSRFRLDVTLAVVAQFRDQAAQIAPDIDLSDEAIRQAWTKAADYRGMT